MAKKRNPVTESGLSGAGTAPARARRKHHETSPAISTPSSETTATPASQENAAAPPPEYAAAANDVPAGPPVAAAEERSDSETVARLAYSYWEARGFQGGSAEEDWLRAERELRSRNSF